MTLLIDMFYIVKGHNGEDFEFIEGLSTALLQLQSIHALDSSFLVFENSPKIDGSSITPYYQAEGGYLKFYSSSTKYFKYYLSRFYTAYLLNSASRKCLSIVFAKLINVGSQFQFE